MDSNKSIRNAGFLWQWLLLCVMALPLTGWGDVVYEEMQGIKTVDSLAEYCKRNGTDAFKLRCILRNLPQIFKEKEVNQCPVWVEPLIDNALNSKNAGLIAEAIPLIGHYRLDGYTDRLAVLFNQALQYYLEYEAEIRNGIIQVFRIIDGEKERELLIEFFNTYPKSLIALNEFDLLVETIADMDTVVLKKVKLKKDKQSQVAEICSQRTKELKTKSKKDDEDREFVEQYERIALNLKRIDEKLSEKKGGEHE